MTKQHQLTIKQIQDQRERERVINLLADTK